MTNPAAERDVCVLLAPAEVGGHEGALAAWLSDAVRHHGLRPWIVAGHRALWQRLAQSELRPCLAGDACGGWVSVAQALAAWPRQRPLLLAPGSLHARPALLAAATLTHRHVWVYVPFTHSARTMGARLAGLRDTLQASVLRRVGHWIVLDDGQARQLRTDWNCRLASTQVLPNLGRLAGPGPRMPEPGADGRLRVAFVGRLDLHQKGLDWLCDELLARPDWARRFHWRFQGDGPGLARLRQVAAQLGPACIELVSHRAIDDAFAVSDLLLLTSRFEGQPLVALEALQRGWPVVASRQSGLATLLPDACQFPFGDHAGLARALQAMASPDERRRAVAQARQRYDLDSVRARYHGAIEALVAQWRALAAAPAATEARPC